MPVATYGAVRGLTPDELVGLGAEILLSNTYHLHERPGEEIIARLGGLHGFTGWHGPWLTDSGGFQVTSLAAHVRIEEQGVIFASPLDGQRRLLTPEKAVGIQEALGSDVAMVLDECRPLDSEGLDSEGPAPQGGGRGEAVSARVRAATDRTLRWAERSRAVHRRPDQALFGIIQGGTSPGLRRLAARHTASLDFHGYAHGGLGLGEEAALRTELLSAVHEVLPATAPRYLMGLGRPMDLIAAIATGVDLFDCVLPTRNGRHGVLFTRQGVLRARNARFREDPSPPDPDCDCPTCARHSRAYLRHLFQAGESLAGRLASVHNLRFYLRLLEEARAAIAAGSFAALAARVASVGSRPID